jgi:hypothetical protein
MHRRDQGAQLIDGQVVVLDIGRDDLGRSLALQLCFLLVGHIGTFLLLVLGYRPFEHGSTDPFYRFALA